MNLPSEMIREIAMSIEDYKDLDQFLTTTRESSKFLTLDFITEWIWHQFCRSMETREGDHLFFCCTRYFPVLQKWNKSFFVAILPLVLKLRNDFSCRDCLLFWCDVLVPQILKIVIGYYHFMDAPVPAKIENYVEQLENFSIRPDDAESKALYSNFKMKMRRTFEDSKIY